MSNLWRCWGSLSWCLTGQLVSGEVTSFGVYEALENLSGQEHRVVGTGKILSRKASVLCVHS